MHCKTRENWPFSRLFYDSRAILTSEGYLLKITLTDSYGFSRGQTGTKVRDVNRARFPKEKTLGRKKHLVDVSDNFSCSGR